MARMIDADALFAEFENVDWYNNADRDEIAERLILQAPTIDAVSVVHGEWKPNPKIGWGETWVCSICGEKTTSSVMGYPRYNYCPMCGAKMFAKDINVPNKKGADDERHDDARRSNEYEQ